ncbi:MAG: hypothetical protein EOM30_11860 [Clostridia bacterium]|nr:hypothetical protein [Clostridia bacterium]NLS84640.1 hypothetical protein [Oscillospiraceae bacterium]
MTQDDIFNVFHYFTLWQLIIIGAVLMAATFFISLTKLSGLGLIAPILLFINPMYNVGLVVFGVVLLGIYFSGWYLGTKRRERIAKEKRDAADALRIAKRDAENAANVKYEENSKKQP